MLQNTVSWLAVRLCATLIYYFTGITGLYFYIYNIIHLQFIASLWFYSAVLFKDLILLYGELKGYTMKITQLQCDINKKKYNFIDLVKDSCS